MRWSRLNKKEQFLAIVIWCQLWLIAGAIIWAWRLYPAQAELVLSKLNVPVLSESNALQTSAQDNKIEAQLDQSTIPVIDTEPVALPDIQQGRIFRRLAGKWATLSAPEYTQGKYIDVDLSQQVMVMYKDGRVFAAFEISSGKKGYATPKGEFKILSKQKNHWSATYGLWMPYSLNFSGAYYIHELPYWPNGYREGEDHLGRPVSHGCIRLGVGAAKEIYDYAEVGTAVYIH
ncbi:MAG: L,D-transpeptidase [Candidatus Spechtbacteria bacterium]|nr:L,D-transpeptidase [Candidatus Spechtbacteria bacterium]